MTHKAIIDPSVNIHEHPAIDWENLAHRDVQLTFGDLHGNPVKLMYILARHGYLSLSAEEYNALGTIFSKSPRVLAFEDLALFHHILAQIRVEDYAKGSFIRFLGDLLAERGGIEGANDYFTLKFIEKLKENGINVEIVLSNHDAEFIENYEKKQPFYFNNILGEEFIKTSINLSILIRRELISYETISSLVENAYKPCLKALSYSFNETLDKITIYSHAPIGLYNIRNLALTVKRDFCIQTIHGIAHTIDAINDAFIREAVLQNRVSELLNLHAIPLDAINGNLPISEEMFAFAHLIYNRHYCYLNRPIEINFVHGHDSSEPTAKNICNLNNTLGQAEGYHIETYTAVYSKEIINPCDIYYIQNIQHIQNEAHPNIPLPLYSIYAENFKRSKSPEVETPPSSSEILHKIIHDPRPEVLLNRIADMADASLKIKIF